MKPWSRSMAAEATPVKGPDRHHQLRGWGRLEQRVILPIATAMFVASLVIMLGEGLSRFSVGQSYDWAEESVRLLMIWAVFLTLALAGRRGFHIRAELAVEAMPDRWRRFAHIVASLAGLGFSVTLLWAGWSQERHLWRLGMMTESTLDLPLWVVFISLPLGAALLVVYYIEAAVTAWKGGDPFEPRTD
jgi:C4-dicarboxylate transporter, DctQ subunit